MGNEFKDIAARLVLHVKGLDGQGAISAVAEQLRQAYDRGVLDTSLPAWGEKPPEVDPDAVLVSMTMEEYQAFFEFQTSRSSRAEQATSQDADVDGVQVQVLPGGP